MCRAIERKTGLEDDYGELLEKKHKKKVIEHQAPLRTPGPEGIVPDLPSL